MFSTDYISCSFRFPKLGLPTTKTYLGNSSNLSSLAEAVRSSIYPKLQDVFSPLEELTDEVTLLNYDYRNNSKLLPAVSKLFAGSVIHSMTRLFVIHSDYSRHASRDTLAETNEERLSVRLSIYPSLLCSCIIDSDGRKMKQKLIIGSNTINVLSTCSTTIAHSPSIDIGPQILLPELAVTSAHARIYLQSEQVKQFKNCFQSNSYKLQPSVSALRQLITGFDHHSTFEPLRSTYKQFDTCLHMPTTVFTYCDTPNNDGFGANSLSSSKLASKLLQIFAISVLTNDGLLHKHSVAQTIRSYDIVAEAKNRKKWESLKRVVDAIKKELQAKDTVDVFRICTIYSMSNLANVASEKVSTANLKIADDIIKRLRHRIFGY